MTLLHLSKLPAELLLEIMQVYLSPSSLFSLIQAYPVALHCFTNYRAQIIKSHFQILMKKLPAGLIYLALDACRLRSIRQVYYYETPQNIELRIRPILDKCLLEPPTMRRSFNPLQASLSVLCGVNDLTDDT